MKLAPKVVFLFRDSEGFASSIADALHPSPSSSAQRVEHPLELPLDRYGIRDQMARGLIVNFIVNGIHQVSMVLLDNYEPPILACAVNEVLSQILETSSSMLMIIAPFLVPSSKIKLESRSLMRNCSKVPLYSVQVGSETDTSRAVAAKTDTAPSSLQIHYEPLACFLQLVNVLKLPTSILIGQRSQSFSDKAFSKELEALYKIGELLESTTSLCFSKDMISWNPSKSSGDGEEPWRALYG
ncbi:hypothetical protein SLA2020_245550 [Shorea laevis]